MPKFGVFCSFTIEAKDYATAQTMVLKATHGHGAKPRLEGPNGEDIYLDRIVAEEEPEPGRTPAPEPVTESDSEDVPESVEEISKFFNDMLDAEVKADDLDSPPAERTAQPTDSDRYVVLDDGSTFGSLNGSCIADIDDFDLDDLDDDIEAALKRGEWVDAGTMTLPVRRLVSLPPGGEGV